MITVSQQNINERWRQAPADIQDALFSSTTEDVLYGFFENNMLTKPQYRTLQRTCALVLLGFVNSKEFFSLLQSEVGVDAKMALAMYQQIDRDIFAPVRNSMESFRRAMQAVADPEVDLDIPQMNEQVVLKDPLISPDEAIDLTTKTGDVAPAVREDGVQGSATSEVLPPREFNDAAPLVLRKDSVPVPTLPQTPQAQPQSFGQADAVPLPPQQPTVSTQTSQESMEMPFILHAENEASPIAQSMPQQSYKPMSYGSFMGSFKTPFSQQRQPQVSKARVEIPLEPFPQRDESSSILRQQPVSQEASPQTFVPAQHIPVTVKKYDQQNQPTAPSQPEKPKVVNYTGFKTDLK